MMDPVLHYIYAAFIRRHGLVTDFMPGPTGGVLPVMVHGCFSLFPFEFTIRFHSSGTERVTAFSVGKWPPPYL